MENRYPRLLYNPVLEETLTMIYNPPNVDRITSAKVY